MNVPVVPVRVRYACGHEEHGRVTGPDVGMLPPDYTVDVPQVCATCRAEQEAAAVHEPAAISPAAAPARVSAADSPAPAAGTSDSITKGMSSWDS